MMNTEIARIMFDIAAYLAMEDDLFRSRAYEKAAESIADLGAGLSEVYAAGSTKALEAIPGVGPSIAEKIEELLKTGRLKYYEQLKHKLPVNLQELRSVEGLGPKTINTLYKELKIKNLKDLERAALSGKIRKLPGFGEKTEERILKSIAFVKKSGGRTITAYAMPMIRDIERLLKSVSAVERLAVVGSVRRRKETIGDVDILVISKHPKPVMDAFVNMPNVGRIQAQGDTKSAVTMANGIDVDIRVVFKESFGAAMNYFTGSKAHNIKLRELAIARGWKLNEYGLFQGTQRIAGESEEGLYKKLGLVYIEPELREMAGEIEASRKNQLPKLIRYQDLKGDLQVQTDWTDGAHSIEEMALAAIKSGLEYIAITDHTKRLAIAHGLDERRIKKQWAEIDAVNRKLKAKGLKFKVLKGTECDILKDGSMDLPDWILAGCDVVGASVHSLFNLSRADQTARIRRAMENPNVDIIFHPTGRLIQKREAYSVDMESLIAYAKKTGTAMEINAFPDRADLSDEYIRKCVVSGVSLSIDSDAHDASHFQYLEYGIAQARRGWAEKSDVVNTQSVTDLLKFFS
ncbi:MAG: DNA polymerase III [Candidatus Harrisonbacteria bacterium RIFCSPLOWO2_02_FULL_45_10c]|uniref:DNA polymerase beta n=1 Tax=Candidatus Harrisonbacteria bacterium RIFCSPLOWO2_02_FULL_45_10c TaxID=1798410 RepID=A0A1G1ZTN4_9BACT|nr:MAG: DNA polymerase III [Candidatus Harrisonbacteria bacterium RIFCSPLOWO2_02_FULL_45_10c]